MALLVTPFSVHFFCAPHTLVQRDGHPVLTASFGDAWTANDRPDATLLGGTHLLWSLAGLQPPRNDESLAGQVEGWLRLLPTNAPTLLPPASGPVGLVRAWLTALMVRYEAMGISRQPGLVTLPHWFEDDVVAEDKATKRRRPRA